MLGEEEGAWEGKKEAGRKEEPRGQVRLPLDRERREGGELWASGWVRSSAKTNLPQGDGGPFLPHTDGIKGKQEPCRAQL